jgi:hypothetical protein
LHRKYPGLWLLKARLPGFSVQWYSRVLSIEVGLQRSALLLPQIFCHSIYFVDSIGFIWDETGSIGDQLTGRVSESQLICDIDELVQPTLVQPIDSSSGAYRIFWIGVDINRNCRADFPQSR